MPCLITAAIKKTTRKKTNKKSKNKSLSAKTQYLKLKAAINVKLQSDKTLITQIFCS